MTFFLQMPDTDEQDSLNLLTLAFRNTGLEQRFLSVYFHGNLQLGRACHLIAAFFYTLFMIWDVAVIDPSRMAVWIPVGSVVVLTFLTGLAVSYRAFGFYARYWRQIYSLYVLLTGVGFTIVTVFSGSGHPVHSFAGIIFCLLFCYSFIRLPFVWAAVSGTAIVIIYVAGTGLMLHLPRTQLFSELFYLTGANLLGMMICYSIELLFRRDFLLNNRLKTEENTVKQINARLEKMVKERTLALTASEQKGRRLQAQLAQSQKMESIGRLAGGVAHDYNNLSSIIIGYTDLLLERFDPSDPCHDDLMEIHHAAKRASEITRQLLAFARKQTIAPQVIDLNHAVEAMLKMLRRLMGEDIGLKWLPGKGTWPVHIDPSQLDQILANLCVNARDAIADVGQVTIETGNATFDDSWCDDHSDDSPGDYVFLAVSDTGSGIPEEHRDRIFEPFFTTKQTGKGTGLGLSTVYGIVRQNSGFISVYSEPGNGTTFKLYLPRHSGQTAASEPDQGSDMPAGRGETILLVEDDAAILKLVERMLTRLGYRVLSAGTPGSALKTALARPKEIALLITDVIMPEMNGRELSDRLKQHCPHLRVLFMSGYTANVIARRGVLDQGVNFLSKPISQQKLAQTVREILDR